MATLTEIVADLVADTAFFSLARAVTGLTGGGATNLDGIVTVSLDVGTIAQVWNGTQFSAYRLTAGTTAESSPTVIRPDDYAGGTNEKVWILMAIQTGAANFYGTVLVSAATTPVLRQENRSVAIPDYSAVGFNPALGGSTVAQMNGIGGSLGGVSVQGFSNSSDERAIIFAAHSGRVTATANPIAALQAWKHNGTTGRTAPTGEDIVWRISAGTTTLQEILANGQCRAVGNILVQSPITGLTGGGATALDGIVTVGISAGATVQVWTGTGLKFYRLTAGTLAENSPWIVRPDDYATTTNEKYWRLESPHAVVLLGSGLWDVPASTFTLPDFTVDPTFTVPLAGEYCLDFTAVCQWKANAGGLLNLRVRDTTAGVSEVSTELVSIGASGAATLSGSHRVTLVAGNTVQLQVCNTAGASGDLELIKASLTYEWSPPAA